VIVIAQRKYFATRHVSDKVNKPKKFFERHHNAAISQNYIPFLSCTRGIKKLLPPTEKNVAKQKKTGVKTCF